MNPVTFHQHVPRDLKKNLEFRQHILERAGDNLLVQQGLMLACEQDILFWINLFVLQFNPNAEDDRFAIAPFITWECQERGLLGGIDPDTGERIYGIVECIADRRDLQIEKSREMGASWLILLVFVHQWLFKRRRKFLVMSRNKEAVDDPTDPDSLFWKIDFLLLHLPDWMVPPKYRKEMSLTNFSNGSVITGTTTTKKAGVGGRAHAMLIDEFSQIDQAREVYDRTHDTTKCRLFNYTHTGPGTMAAELAMRADVRKMVLHWSMHPEKRRGLYRCVDGKIEILDTSYEFPPDYPFDASGTPGGKRPGVRSVWYDYEEGRRGKGSRGVRMDLDIDPHGASEQFYQVLQIQRVVRELACPPYWEGDIDFDARTGKPIGLVERPFGPLKLWVHPKDGRPPSGIFTVFADTATGKGTTPSCASIMNASTGEKAGHYVNATITPYEFGVLCVALCWLFRDDEPALLGWETGGAGDMLWRKVDEIEYRRIYYPEDDSRPSFEHKRSSKPGWVPTERSKLILHNEYADALYRGSVTNRSEMALRQTLGFVHEGKSVQFPEVLTIDKTEKFLGPTGENLAGRVSHGDLVVADAGAWMLAKTLGAGRIPEPDEDEERQFGIGTLAGRRRMHEDRQRGRDAWVR